MQHGKFATLLLLYFFFFNHFMSAANDGYKIAVKVNNLKDSVCYLGFYYGDKKYVQDTARVNDAGQYVFEGNEPLEGGVYFVYAPKNLYLEIIVNEQHFSIETDANDPVGSLKVKDSRENQVFMQLQQYGIEKQQQIGKLREALETHKDNADSTARIQQQIQKINEALLTYRKKLIRENPDLFVSRVIQASEVIEVPETLDTQATDPDKAKYQYYKTHFLDHIDLADIRMLKTPVFHNKLMEYFDKVVVQHPDSVFEAAREVLNKAQPNEDMFRYILTNLASKYETSNVMGMESVFVKLAEEYYLSGKATWVEEDVLAKIKEKVEETKPTLIGKQAPPMTLMDTLGSPVSLYDIEADYLILYFYDPTCSNCKKKTPVVHEAYQHLKNEGVKVLAVNTITDADEWKEYINENELDWINAGDIHVRSNFRYEYNIESVPRVFILDKNKKIIARRLGAEDIEPFMKNYIKSKRNSGS